MSHEIIEIPGSGLFKHYGALGSAAVGIAVQGSLSNISLNVLEAVRKRPSARAPDRPSSTR